MNVIKTCKHGQFIYNPNDEYIGRSLTNYGEYEEEEVRFFESVIKEGDWVLDIGANIGTHTIAFSKLVGNGAVWAFEPQRQVYYALCGNIAINNLSNVYAFQQVVSNKDGQMKIPELDFKVPGNFGGLELHKKYAPNKPNTMARMTTIDLMKLKRCNFIKIDVEGMEMNVLAGARNTIIKFQPILFVENDRLDMAKDLTEYIIKLGYKTYIYKSLLFNKNNFHKNQNNVFGFVGCLNLICIPNHMADQFEAASDFKPFDGVFDDNDKSSSANAMSIIRCDSINYLLESAQKCSNIHEYEKAEEYLNIALKIKDDEHAVYTGLAALMYKKTDFSRALTYLDKSLSLEHSLANLNSKGLTLGFLNRPKEAIECFREYLMHKENDAQVHFNMSLDMIKSGDFKEGFREYEWRLLLPKSSAYMERFGSKPIWEGSPNKKVLLFIEQGVGDFIQFVRYAKLLKERGCYVISEMWDDVKDLFKDYPYIDEFVAIRKYGEDDCKLPEFDCIASWCSLPYIFKTTTETIPSDVPYITVKDGFDDINGGIGIVWAGSTVHDHDHIRSCYLRDLKPLDGLKLYSLQKGSMQRVWNNTGPVDLMDGSDVKYTDLAPRINDFNDTAKIISKLDAVATVDTSVAHLAAAMGKPVYLALGKSNDFRWFDKGSSSPWYPTVQIFRQESSWLQVWEQVRQKL